MVKLYTSGDKMATRIVGVIENSLEELIPDCYVEAYDHQGGGSTLGTMADSSGYYEITVSDNNHYYDVTVWHSGYTIEEQDTIYAPEGKDTHVDFVPPDHDLKPSVVGVVQDDEGLPVEDANVWGEGSSYKFGAKTNADGEYVLPLHRADTYIIKAVKNNFSIRSNVSVTQSGNHPTSTTTVDFTGSYHLERNLGTDRLGYAVYGRSVVARDRLDSSGTLIQANEPATTTVFMKTRRWGSGSVLTTTYSGDWNLDEGDGHGGTNYSGDCGDCGE